MTATASQQFQRAVRGMPFTLSYTWGLNDEAVPDADSVTVTVTDAEGDTVTTGDVTQGSETDGQETATAVIPAASLPQRDLLTVTWAFTVSSVAMAVTSTVDVCDARLFSLADYAAYPEIAQKDFSAGALEQARTDAEDFIERECGRAFTGRYGTEDHLIARRGRGFGVHGSAFFELRGIGRLPLRRPHVHTIRSITRTWTDSDGPQSATLDLTHLHLDTFASVIDYHATNGDALWGQLAVAYEHGESVPDVRRVCAILARHRLLKGPLDDRATQISVEGGGSVNLLTPGLLGSITGIPEVDVFISRYNSQAISFVSGA